MHCQDLEIEKLQIKSGFPASGEKADLGTAGLFPGSHDVLGTGRGRGGDGGEGQPTSPDWPLSL